MFAPGSKAYVHIPKDRRIAGEKLDQRAEGGMILGWQRSDYKKPVHIFTVYLADRPGSLIQKITSTSSLTAIERIVHGPKKTEIDNDDPDDEESLETIEVGGEFHQEPVEAIDHRTAAPNSHPRQ